MYIVRPITMETLWGDTRLHAYQGDRAAQTIGCVYTLSGIDGIDCEIYNEKEETTLRRAVKKNPAVFGLEDGEEFPLIPVHRMSAFRFIQPIPMQRSSCNCPMEKARPGIS